jgi:hypothetical protein
MVKRTIRIDEVIQLLGQALFRFDSLRAERKSTFDHYKEDLEVARLGTYHIYHHLPPTAPARVSNVWKAKMEYAEDMRSTFYQYDCDRRDWREAQAETTKKLKRRRYHHRFVAFDDSICDIDGWFDHPSAEDIELLGDLIKQGDDWLASHPRERSEVFQRQVITQSHEFFASEHIFAPSPERWRPVADVEAKIEEADSERTELRNDLRSKDISMNEYRRHRDVLDARLNTLYENKRMTMTVQDPNTWKSTNVEDRGEFDATSDYGD